MRVFYSDKHLLRNARTELYGGELIPPFESAKRIEIILAELEKRGHRDIQAPEEFPGKIAETVHDRDYLDFLENAWDLWTGNGYKGEAIPTVFPARSMRSDVRPIDIDGQLGYYCLAIETSICKGTWEASLASKDVSLSAARLIAGGTRSAFALCRPPGHHASKNQYGGYCFINNAALAAQFLRDNGASRVAVLDIDFHHGNGTQAIFYDRADVLTVNIHGDPRYAFPHFLGYEDERGAGHGEGFNFNYPLPSGTAFETWSTALSQSLKEIKNYGPDCLVVSLGVDTFREDPISFFKLDNNDFLACGRMLRGADRPTLFVMEGGYAVDHIGVNVVNVLEGFEND